MTEQEMMNRYIYQVTRRVPAGQREDIGMELQGLISDMLEAEQCSVEQVLEKLGDPSEFAKQYRNEKNYVIGPEYYDNYIWILKIVAAAVALSAVVSDVMHGITDSHSLVGFFTVVTAKIIEDTIINVVGAFGMVTLIFAVLEYCQVKVDLGDKRKKEATPQTWTPKLLQPVPDKKSAISRGESGVGIVFLLIFSGLMIFAPQLFGAYVFEDGKFIRSISVFNLEQWGTILPFFFLSFLFCFTDEVIRLVTGCYCKLVMISNIISGFAQIVLGAIMLKLLPFWNPDFITDMSKQFDMNISSKGDLLYYWGSDFFSNVILTIIIFAVLLEMGTTIYKTIRYEKSL